MNKYIQKTELTEWMTKGKTTLTQKVPFPQRNLPKQQSTHNVLTDDVENTNDKN